jgi:hypothetical protein
MLLFSHSCGAKIPCKLNEFPLHCPTKLCEYQMVLVEYGNK